MEEEHVVAAGIANCQMNNNNNSINSSGSNSATCHSRRDAVQQQPPPQTLDDDTGCGGTIHNDGVTPPEDAEAINADVLNTSVDTTKCNTVIRSTVMVRSSPRLRPRPLTTTTTTTTPPRTMQRRSSSSPRVVVVVAGAAPDSSRKHLLSQRKATPKSSIKHSVMSKALLRTAEKEEDLSLVTFISADTDDDNSALASPTKKQAVERIKITATEINCTASKLFEDEVQDCYTTILDRVSIFSFSVNLGPSVFILRVECCRSLF